jgi:two-component system, cell cycle sensor histidine kinase and response regulator CckA
MLAFSGRGRFQVAHLSVNDLIRENAELLRTGIPRTITLDLDLYGEEIFIDADRGQMQQIVMNLITNASEAIGEKAGTITLSTGLIDCSAEDLEQSRVPEKPQPGTFLYIDAKDTGSGMDAATQAKMFDPFFTTKFTGRGLGLSAAQGIVKGHKGAIFVKSKPGYGTSIRVLFPASAGDVGGHVNQTGSTPQPAVNTAFSGTILVVDDEEMVLELGREIVEELGFQSLGACDGEVALSLFDQHTDEITCVLLDLTMPKKDGVETFKELRRRRNNVRVILSSGYSEQEVADRFRGAGLSGFVQKPYRFNDLKQKLAEVLSIKP